MQFHNLQQIQPVQFQALHQLQSTGASATVGPQASAVGGGEGAGVSQQQQQQQQQQQPSGYEDGYRKGYTDGYAAAQKETRVEMTALRERIVQLTASLALATNARNENAQKAASARAQFNALRKSMDAATAENDATPNAGGDEISFHDFAGSSPAGHSDSRASLGGDSSMIDDDGAGGSVVSQGEDDVTCFDSISNLGVGGRGGGGGGGSDAGEQVPPPKRRLVESLGVPSVGSQSVTSLGSMGSALSSGQGSAVSGGGSDGGGSKPKRASNNKSKAQQDSNNSNNNNDDDNSPADSPDFDPTVTTTSSHVNYLYHSLDDVTYPRFEPGRVFAVALPKSKNASHRISSECLLKTRALDAQRHVLTHCAHYYFNRVCNRGAECCFVHAVSVPDIRVWGKTIDLHAVEFVGANKSHSNQSNSGSIANKAPSSIGAGSGSGSGSAVMSTGSLNTGLVSRQQPLQVPSPSQTYPPQQLPPPPPHAALAAATLIPQQHHQQQHGHPTGFASAPLQGAVPLLSSGSLPLPQQQQPTIVPAASHQFQFQHHHHHHHQQQQQQHQQHYHHGTTAFLQPAGAFFQQPGQQQQQGSPNQQTVVSHATMM